MKLIELIVTLLGGLISTALWIILWFNPLWFREDLLNKYYRSNFSYFNPFR